jgi:hypothetical protein
VSGAHAAEVLGREHPVARAARRRDRLVGQAIVGGCLVVGAGVAALARPAPATHALVGVAAVVEAWLLAAALFATTILRDRARDAIADGDCAADVVEVAIERDRLLDRGSRARLAGTLERALYQAEHWYEIPISTRPPATAAELAARAEIVAEVARLVRDPASSARGVALADRLLRDGYASPLYGGSGAALDEELRRIRYLLS